MPVEFKRPGEAATAVAVVAKRARNDWTVSAETTTRPGPSRLSSLLAPIMLLQGHEGEIYAGRFSPDGACLASGGFDQKIFLWNVYGECENFSVFTGHAGAVMELQFGTDSSKLYSCSTDKTVRIWDMETGSKLRKWKGHQSFVNSVHPARRGPPLVATGSDDGTTRVWDERKREPVHTLQNTYQVTAVTFGDTSDIVISSGIDNVIKVWDLRRQDLLFALPGHKDTVTGLSLSPDGTHLLSNSMDCSARVWDIRPFAQGDRCVSVFGGHQHNFEKNLLRCAWSPDGERVTCGSADRYVYVWEVSTRRILYKLPGHQGSVNQTDFHPIENILLSAGSDKKVFLGEIQ